VSDGEIVTEPKPVLVTLSVYCATGIAVNAAVTVVFEDIVIVQVLPLEVVQPVHDVV
jgi:hypothetical protein